MELARPSLRIAVLALAMVLALAAPTPQPAHASGSTCNGDVCSEILTSGTTLDRWKTVAYIDWGYKCRTAKYWVNGGLWRSQNHCGNGPALVSYVYGPYTFPLGTQLCVSWSSTLGYACLTM